MDILLIDEKIKNNLNSVDKKFYFLDTSHIINTYKKILSKPILRSNEKSLNKSDIIKEYLKIIKVKYINLLSMPTLEKILYFDNSTHSEMSRTCENCKGTNIEACENYFTCEDCGYMITKILYISTSCDVKRVNTRRIYKSTKKKSESLEVLRLANISLLAEEERYFIL